MHREKIYWNTIICLKSCAIVTPLLERKLILPGPQLERSPGSPAGFLGLEGIQVSCLPFGDVGVRLDLL